MNLKSCVILNTPHPHDVQASNTQAHHFEISVTLANLGQIESSYVGHEVHFAIWVI